MSALRWILASATALVMVGFIALLGFADSFRRSFGASENGPLVALLPVTAILVFLAGLIFPGQRALLHVAAAWL
jgi:multisubunit Na+/H+ antiporter MnhG subunit